MSEWPEFTLCVLPTEDLTDMQKWILEHGDRYDLGELTMNQQIALGAELESWIPDLKEALEEERKIEDEGVCDCEPKPKHGQPHIFGCPAYGRPRKIEEREH